MKQTVPVLTHQSTDGIPRTVANVRKHNLENVIGNTQKRGRHICDKITITTSFQKNRYHRMQCVFDLDRQWASLVSS